jgi:hypothetical protein
MAANSSIEKIAFIVGAGAVENAWQPILKLFEDALGHKIDADGANCRFARLVYLMRFYATGTSPDAKKYLKGLSEEVLNMKAEIANALIFAEQNGQIKARKELKDILYKFIFAPMHKSVLITTNWDTVIDNAINILGETNHPKSGSDIESIHFHGSVNEPHTLYLPSEVVKEPYRSDKDDKELGSLHGTVWQTLEQCTKTILYGLSIDPLDAELSQTLAAGWSSPNLKEVIIINPDHKKVSQRVKLLLDERYPAKITGYSPSNLNEKYEYQQTSH